MKSTTTTLFAFFLLLAFISHLPSTTLADFVVDTKGEYLKNGGAYYILPIIRGSGGGIGLAITGNEICPLTVVQERSEVSKGLPIIIRPPPGFLTRYIAEGIPLDLAFTAVPTCAPTPSNWTIVKGLPEGPSVKLTGYGNTVDGSFNIEKFTLGYKLGFCDALTGSCSGIGVYHDDEGNRRLVLTDSNPLVVQFQEVTSSSA